MRVQAPGFSHGVDQVGGGAATPGPVKPSTEVGQRCPTATASSPELVQLPMLERHCDDVRFVWNLAREQANCWHRDRGPTPGPGSSAAVD